MVAKSNARRKKPKTSSTLSVPFYTKAGNKSGTVTLPKEIFGHKPSPSLIAQAVRVFLAGQRKSWAKTKSRGEVNRTTRKWYRQKGTGGARHGARSAPLFVGGGRAHGPRGIENYKIGLPAKMANQAFAGALAGKLLSREILVADIEAIGSKTSVVAKFLGKISGRDLTIVHSGSQNLFRAARNIKGVTVRRADELNVYDVIASRKLILTKQSLEVLGKRGAKYAA